MLKPENGASGRKAIRLLNHSVVLVQPPEMAYRHLRRPGDGCPTQNGPTRCANTVPGLDAERMERPLPRGKPNYIDPIRKGATFNVKVVPKRKAVPTVYFVQAENGLIKIGNTKYLNYRLESLRNQGPLALALLATVPGGRAEEFAYHAAFAAHRLHGEWFAPHPDILAEIERINAS